MEQNKTAYVELKHINKVFNDFKASDDVSFSVEKGKLIGLWDQAEAERQQYLGF